MCNRESVAADFSPETQRAGRIANAIRPVHRTNGDASAGKLVAKRTVSVEEAGVELVALGIETLRQSAHNASDSCTLSTSGAENVQHLDQLSPGRTSRRW